MLYNPWVRTVSFEFESNDGFFELRTCHRKPSAVQRGAGAARTARDERHLAPHGKGVARGRTQWPLCAAACRREGRFQRDECAASTLRKVKCTKAAATTGGGELGQAGAACTYYYGQRRCSAGSCSRCPPPSLLLTAHSQITHTAARTSKRKRARARTHTNTDAHARADTHAIKPHCQAPLAAAHALVSGFAHGHAVISELLLLLFAAGRRCCRRTTLKPLVMPSVRCLNGFVLDVNVLLGLPRDMLHGVPRHSRA